MKDSKFSGVQIIKVLSEQNQEKQWMRFAENTASVSLLFINGKANMADWMYSNSLKWKNFKNVSE